MKLKPNAMTNSFSTKSGKTLFSRQISSEDAALLVKQKQGQLLDDYSSDICEYYRYLLNDGAVVNIPAGPDAYIYEPYDAFIDHMEETYIAKKLSKERPFLLTKRLANGNSIQVEKIYGDEIDRLKALSQYFGNSKQAFLLPDGRVMENRSIETYLYRNAEDYEALTEHVRNATRLSHKINKGELDGDIWLYPCALNPYDTEFPDHAKELASRLPRLINAPETLFNFSWGSLVDIDFYLYKNVISQEFSEQVFLPLIAYIGESYIKQKGGQWEMQYNHACGDWLPDVRQADGELKMLYYPISIILNPEEGKGTYYALRAAFSHIASHPVD